jgi:DNA repair exonuclease SbcCD ATPase subunit
MNIKSIKVRNFYSIEDLELDLSKYTGITLIEGKNNDLGGSNGSGKSSLIEAIFWGLTGKTIRKSNEIALVNNKNKKKCLVELTLDNNIVIRRQRKPTFLELFIGEENRTKESVNSTQADIEALLGFNHKSLLCTSFFGQHNGFSFLDSSPDDKRSIINNFLNLEDIITKRKIVKDLKSGYYQEAKSLLAVIKEYTRSIDDLARKKESIVELKKEYHNKFDEYALSLSLEDILKAEADDRRAYQTISDYKRELNALRDRQEDLKERLEGKHFICDKCEQDLPELPEEELKTDLAFCKTAIKDNLSSCRNIADSIIPLSITSKEFAKLEEYRDLCRDSETYGEFIEELQNKIKEAEENRTQQEVMYEVMKFWEKAFSEQGVIKYIIRNILDYFNTKANYYLSYLCDNHYVITFDEELNEKITSRGLETQYISLSGGEKRKINLAVLMALKDIFVLNSSYDADMLFFDEIAENLDEKGINGLYNLLQEIKKDKNVFVITHNKYLKANLDSANTITIIKTDGNTQLGNK